MGNKLIEINNVTKVFRIGGLVWGIRLVAVDHVSLSMDGNTPSILSIVGESGSGKTTLARILLRLVEPTRGEVFLEGKSLFKARDKIDDHQFKRLVQPIFQNPFETFSMRKPVDTYLYETAINLGIVGNRREAREVIADALSSVGLDLNAVSGKYPNQFSGGELQRISVARALIPKPRLIIADEPVSMIDASLRMNIVNLFLSLKSSHNISFLYITHDLSTAYYVSDSIAIMYRGHVVEYGPSNMILTEPAHPYTELLMESIPKIGEKWSENFTLPDLEVKEYTATACKFAPRCVYARQICRQHKPPMIELPEGRQVLCFRPVDYTLTR
ncbi:MAG: ABC transporter ATP-binding protein [Anaerolineae bacterium]|nr:ABC transporter ATP-binding protein [Anaerolineae bacterium]MDW8097940.1 ABC transporter ATP-binding protein [Anaerolineae bacterium]